MSVRYAIHPAVGVARVGNSQNFYLAPVTIGGLPIECDENGTMRWNGEDDPVFVQSFKQDEQIRPQAARFSLYAHDDEHGKRREVTLDDADIESIEWTVHLANKKSCWYLFEQRAGDLTLPNNTYDELGIPRRNPSVRDGDRANLIIDPGPRTVCDRRSHANFTAEEANGYHCRFPEPVGSRAPVTTLGQLRTDDAGRLLVIGGPGAAFGPELDPAPYLALAEAARADAAAPRGGYAPADEWPGWYDDLGDGPVVCTISFKDPAKCAISRSAWCIVCPPKYAPELVNAVTLDDVMFDVAVRHFGLLNLSGDTAPKHFVVNYDRDIAPIIDRCAQASWSTTVPSAAATGYPKFNPRDKSETNRRNRERYARLFRRDSARFFDENGVPMLPLHAGSDHGSSSKGCFDTLTGTQLRMLRLWAAGHFTTGPAEPLRGVDALDRAAVGNCVGSPMDPGIEATWTLCDPAIYDAPWCIKHRHQPEHYATSGLSLDENEQDGKGCEPGDLTKRLISPWQWDFANCALEEIVLNDVELAGVPVPPVYEVAWWPAQRPVNIVYGLHNDDITAVKPGAIAEWARSAWYPEGMLKGWTSLGFVVNQNSTDGAEYPYFTEVERQLIHPYVTPFDAAYKAFRELERVRR